jgi:hypothetical protein
MEVDVIGIDNVIENIKLTGLTKFSIDRVGSSKNTLPIYELLNSNSNDKAVIEFRKWANIYNNSIPYKITLFNKLETAVDEFGNEKNIKSKGKAEKAEFYFRINESPSNLSYGTQNYNLSGVADRETIRREILKENDENEIKNQIANLSSKIDKMMSEEEEEEEEEKSVLEGLNGINIANIVTLLQGLNLMKAPVKQAINGIDDNSEFKTNINKAIKTLYKNNPKLDSDLLKLADISETNPSMFNMLLNTLRTM